MGNRLMCILKLCEWNFRCTNSHSRGEAAEGGGWDNYNDTRTRRRQKNYANAKRFLDPACRVRSEHLGAA